ncbi:Protein URA2 [Psilocybe cubensis]|uniref:Protein URA2 n=1 Tax=Psilocybe cubensis TaxID=181762 RepID=A0ACB8GJJ1_PSICU|nr:Protein URA2 [Psilocybe cubensis]KAH9475620.1 Protein URA2 [Psilocybe cubensis]
MDGVREGWRLTIKIVTADPVLGVEMASTVKVACFGYDKYEVYLKALILTGIVPPKKNILFSIGSYKEKLEILPLVQKLSAAGYNIFATSGTSNFLTEHGVHPRAVGMVSLMRWRTLRLEMEAGLMKEISAPCKSAQEDIKAKIIRQTWLKLPLVIPDGWDLSR